MRIQMIILTALFWISCGNDPQQTVQEKKQIQQDTLQPIEQKVDTILMGIWVLDSLPQSPTPVAQLYPRQRPMILVQPDLHQISGSTGCNRFSATIKTENNKLAFTNFTRSNLICAGNAEQLFLKAFENSNRYSIRSNNELVLGEDSVTWMVFKRK